LQPANMAAASGSARKSDEPQDHSCLHWLDRVREDSANVTGAREALHRGKPRWAAFGHDE
jgi:hypothetical protein